MRRLYKPRFSALLLKTAVTDFEEGYPRVWTLLKRPIFDWYNPFWFEWVEDDKLHFGQATFPWWEDYKQDIANLKGDRGTNKHVRMYRLVAHEPGPEADDPKDLDGVKEYWLYSDEYLKLKAALEQKAQVSNVLWYPSVEKVLERKKEFHPTSVPWLHLIGKPAALGATKGKKVVWTHFHEQYHDTIFCQWKEPSDYIPGVYVKYLRTPENLVTLDWFDDVFIVELSSRTAFGLAYVDEQIRDVNGLLILHQANLTKGGVRPVLEHLKTAWSAAQKEFCLCVK